MNGKKIVKKWLKHNFGDMPRALQKAVPIRAKEKREWKNENAREEG